MDGRKIRIDRLPVFGADCHTRAIGTGFVTTSVPERGFTIEQPVVPKVVPVAVVTLSRNHAGLLSRVLQIAGRGPVALR